MNVNNYQQWSLTGHRALISRGAMLLLICGMFVLVACDSGAVVPPAEAEPAAAESNAAVEVAETSVPEEEVSDDAAVADAAGEGEAISEPTGDLSQGAASELTPLERDGMYSAPPEMVIDPAKFYYATIKSDKGDMRIQLFADRAPMTVNNFVFLAREGYYNNTVFHRVLDGFMAQAGDPTGTGAGGPGYEFEDEFYPGLGFDRGGLLAMANRGPTTNGSQFFLTFGPTEWLNNNHTIFGELIEGQDVLDSLTRRDPGQAPDFPGDEVLTILIEESDESILPPPTPAPPTPTPTSTPTPYAPTSMEEGDRPLAELDLAERVNIFNVPPEETVIDESKQYTATISTSKGDLTVALFADEAPVSVNNFVVLAELGFYDGLPIGLVNPEIVLFGSPDQADPTLDVGYIFPAEKNLTQPLVIGSMAYIPNQENPSLSSGSQILMAIVPPPDGVQTQFSFFAEITAGLEILTELTLEDTITAVTIESE